MNQWNIHFLIFLLISKFVKYFVVQTKLEDHFLYFEVIKNIPVQIHDLQLCLLTPLFTVKYA